MCCFVGIHFDTVVVVAVAVDSDCAVKKEIVFLERNLFGKNCVWRTFGVLENSKRQKHFDKHGRRNFKTNQDCVPMNVLSTHSCLIFDAKSKKRGIHVIEKQTLKAFCFLFWIWFFIFYTKKRFLLKKREQVFSDFELFLFFVF